MNPLEDEELMGQFAQRYQNSEELVTLQRRNTELEAELNRAFETVTSMANTIRRYRTLLKNAMDRKATSAPPIPTPPQQQLESVVGQQPPLPAAPTAPRAVREHCTPVYTLTTHPLPEAATVAEPPAPKRRLLDTPASTVLSPPQPQQQLDCVVRQQPLLLAHATPRAVKEHCTQVYTLTTHPMPEAATVAAPPVKQRLLDTPTPLQSPSPSQHQPQLPHPPLLLGGDLVEDNRIRMLTRERSDGFPDVYSSNIIWQTVVRFFNTNANANLMDEHLIIREAGLSLLDHNKPVLTRTMVHKYFTYPFTFKPTDQTMIVRTRMIGGKPVWMVFIPDWLKSVWRTAGKPQGKT